MDLKLTRKAFLKSGIFSELRDLDGNFIAETLEHAYPAQEADVYLPKIPNGTFVCRRGQHQLLGQSKPFETFEITGVAGHTNLLFHVGNFNNDSEGCVLVGSIICSRADGTKYLLDSKTTFAKFMQKQFGVDSFTLIVAFADNLAKLIVA